MNFILSIGISLFSKFVKTDSTTGKKSANWTLIVIGLLLVVLLVLGGLLLWEKYQHSKTKLTLQEQVALTTAQAIDIENLNGAIIGMESVIDMHEHSIESVNGQLNNCYESARKVQSDMDEINRIISGDLSGYEEHTVTEPQEKESTDVKTVEQKQVQAGFDFINRQFDTVR